jgi:hypothetical protein
MPSLEEEAYRLMETHRNFQLCRNYGDQVDTTEAYALYKALYPQGCDRETFEKGFTNLLGYTIDAEGKTKNLTELVRLLLETIPKEGLHDRVMYLDYLESAYLTDRCYDKSQENGLYYQLLYNYMLEKNKDVFTSEYLRQFFASDYLAIQYIAISRLDNDGNPLGETEDQAQKDKAEAALSAMLSDNADYSAIIEEYNEDPEMIGLTEPLVLSRAAVKDDYPFLLPAFQLAAGEFDGIYTTDDGYYILIRSAVSANYYAEHQEDIYHTAVNTAFQQAMEDWMKTCKITTTKVFDKMNLDNLAEYVK